MVGSIATQKLERLAGQVSKFHGNVMKCFAEQKVGLKLFVDSSLWRDCRMSVRNQLASEDSPVVASEALVQAQVHAVTVTELVLQKKLVLEIDVQNLLMEIAQVVALLGVNSVVGSSEVTEALSHLISSCCSLYVTSSGCVEVKALLDVSLQKFRSWQAVFPIKSVLSLTKLVSCEMGKLPWCLQLAVVYFEESKCGNSNLCDNLCKTLALGVCNKPTRFFLYFRGDEHRLARVIPSAALKESSLIQFCSNPRFGGTQLSEAVTLTWLESLPGIFRAFLVDSSWCSLSIEQRRLKLNKLSSRKSVKNELAGSNVESRSTYSSSTTLSVASTASFQSFMSVLDGMEIDQEEVAQHESEDGNTNLALIFVEQVCLAIHRVVCQTGGEGSLKVAELAWKQIASLFQIIQESISRSNEGLERFPVFNFASDIRFNKGLGFQTLGLIFAKLLCPLLEAEGQDQWSLVKTKSIRKSLVVCLNAYESIAPQVITNNLQPILSVLLESLGCEEVSLPLEEFGVRVLQRMGKSNTTLTFLKILNSLSSVNETGAMKLITNLKVEVALRSSVADAIDVEGILVFLDELSQTSHNSFSLRLMGIIADGLCPSTLTSSTIGDKAAELDLVLGESITKFHTVANNEGVKVGCRTLLAVRNLLDRCLLDLGLENCVDYLRVLEDTLWQFSCGEHVVGMLLIGDLEEAFDGDFVELARIVLQRITLCKSISSILGLCCEMSSLGEFLEKNFIGDEAQLTWSMKRAINVSKSMTNLENLDSSSSTKSLKALIEFKNQILLEGGTTNVTSVSLVMSRLLISCESQDDQVTRACCEALITVLQSSDSRTLKDAFQADSLQTKTLVRSCDRCAPCATLLMLIDALFPNQLEMLRAHLAQRLSRLARKAQFVSLAIVLKSLQIHSSRKRLRDTDNGVFTTVLLEIVAAEIVPESWTCITNLLTDFHGEQDLLTPLVEKWINFQDFSLDWMRVGLQIIDFKNVYEKLIACDIKTILKLLPSIIAQRSKAQLLRLLSHCLGECAMDPDTCCEAIRCVSKLSRVAGFRLSSLKRYLKRAIQCLCSLIVSGEVHERQLEAILTSVRLIRLPLAQIHGDESFVDLELHFVSLIPDLLNSRVTSTKRNRQLSTAIAKESLHVLASTFIDMNVFRKRTHMMAPLFARWFSQMVRGLDTLAYDGSIANIFGSILQRLARSLKSRSELTNRSGSFDSFTATTDQLIIQYTSIVSNLFSLCSHHVSIFAKFSTDLDFICHDLLKLLQKERLPDLYAQVNKRDESRKSVSAHSFVDLAYVTISHDDGKSLLKQAMLTTSDAPQGHNIILHVK